MKRIYDFVYSPGALSPTVVWYSVKVGTSMRDQAACRYVMSVAKDNISFLFTLHSQEMCSFKLNVACSLFPQAPGKELAALNYLREVMIDICQLASWLKTRPHSFLNAPVIIGELRSPFLPVWQK